MNVISSRVYLPGNILKKRCNCFSVLSTNMSLKHLAAGSTQPPTIEGKLRLYSMEYCPYAQRTRLELLAKNIPHDIVNINLIEKPDWFLKIHPEGKVPVIDTGSEIVIESLDISDFLEKKYPEPSLYSKNPETRKRDQGLIQKIEPIVKVFYKTFMAKEPKTPQEIIKDFAFYLEDFESELAKRRTTFFGGDKPGVVDYMLWPWSERSEVMPFAFERNLFVTDDFPIMKKWHEDMKTDPACLDTYNSPEKHGIFIQMLQRKIPFNYNFDNVRSKI